MDQHTHPTDMSEPEDIKGRRGVQTRRIRQQYTLTMHNHITRDIKPKGQCPACNDYWNHPICYCTYLDGWIYEDPNHPCEHHFPKDTDA